MSIKCLYHECFQELATLKGEIAALKVVLAKKEQEAQKTAESMEGRVKMLLKHAKHEKGLGGEKEHVVYLPLPQKLKRFKGRPLRGTPPSAEDWIEHGKSIRESTCKRLTKEQTRTPHPGG